MKKRTRCSENRTRMDRMEEPPPRNVTEKKERIVQLIILNSRNLGARRVLDPQLGSPPAIPLADLVQRVQAIVSP